MKKAAKKAAKKEKKHGKGRRSSSGSSEDEADRRKAALSGAIDPSFIRGAAGSGRDWDRDKSRDGYGSRYVCCIYFESYVSRL